MLVIIKFNKFEIITPDVLTVIKYVLTMTLKMGQQAYDKYVLSERALWIINFDTSIIKIGWKMGKLWALKKFNMANI